MIGFNILNTTYPALENINFLYSLLLQGKSQYEQIATNIAEKELRRTVLTVAQQNKQYSRELFSQIESLGGIPPAVNENTFETGIPESHFNNNNEILAFCKMNEKKMVTEYRKLLNGPLLYKDLREILEYQLKGISYSFAQLKLLYSLNSCSPGIVNQT